MKRKCFGRWVLWLAVLLLLPGIAMAEEDTDVSIYSIVTQAPQEVQEQQNVPELTAVPEATPQITPAPQGAREELIDRMLALAKKLSDEAGGRPRRAHYAGDIYVCKNFTVHIFRENAGDFEMAEYPGVKLVIPNNLPRAESRPLAYGIFWQDVPADKGNPFYAAHSFAYDANLSKEENRARAMDMMRQVQRGDFFQMSANYAYGVGAHSLVFTQDYDPDTNQVTWTDSNMNGLTRNGERYGYVQFDAKKDIGWFVDAFCQRTRGATLYRLREDIVRK